MDTGLSLTSVVLFLPLIGFIIILFMNEERQTPTIRWTADACGRSTSST